MKLKYALGFMLLSFIFACSNDSEELIQSQLFGLSETAMDFQSAAGKKSVAVLGAEGEVTASVVSANSEWCKVEIKKGNALDSIQVTVEENLKAKSRTATVNINQGEHQRQFLVRQSQKFFTSISKVLNLSAAKGPGQVRLTWTEPVEDNFNHVKVSAYNSGGDLHSSVVVAKGVTEHVISGLLSSGGEYSFEVQSFDLENEAGEIASIKSSAGKNVAFRFKEVPLPKWVGYYFKSSERITSTLQIGSNEFNQGEEVTISFDVDKSIMDEYNQSHGDALELMPGNAYSLSGIVYTSAKEYQNMSLSINTSSLKDRHSYAIPVKIKSVSSNLIDETFSTALLIYRVDDLAGWYTVERLSKCGEPESAYPDGKRRYIKRTGEYTWETGYLFREYANSEESEQTGITGSVQYITIDPSTKQLHIQQGSYGTNEDLNSFNAESNELIIDYEYSEWAGWWTNERMYNRGFTK